MIHKFNIGDHVISTQTGMSGAIIGKFPDSTQSLVYQIRLDGNGLISERYEHQLKSYVKEKPVSKVLQVTEERVLEAAKTCSDAARILKTLFPESFTPPGPDYVKSSEVLFEDRQICEPGKKGVDQYIIAPRSEGKYSKIGFFLNKKAYKFSIVEDEFQSQVLLVERKQK